ncbi:MAG: RNA ligase [Gemmataceae bacterium]
MDKLFILLVGPQGSGKSTYCREHLADCVRISQDEQGKSAHLIAFEEALARGEPRIVVDRINHRKEQRRRYLGPARQAGYRTKVVWLNADRAECLKRCKARTDHPTLEPREAEEAINLYFRQFQIPSRREADEIEIIGPPPTFVPVIDLTEELAGRRYLIVGDVHGCYDELQALLAELRFDRDTDVLISVGDIVDRGPKVRECIEWLFALPRFRMVLGNHEEKFLRYLRGRDVKIGHGLETTIAAYGGAFPPDLADTLDAQPLILKTPAGYIVHAGFDPEMPPEEQNSADCLYMRFHGGRSYFDELNGRVWYSLWPKDGPRVFFGHIPDPEGPDEAHVTSLDGGCVFGGCLKVWDSHDGRVHRFTAKSQYSQGTFFQGRVPTAAESLRLREDYVARGLLRGDRTDDGELVVYTYTDGCVYDGAWDEITLNSRGHVFDTGTGECVAWPFPKFFNLGENALSQPGMYPWHDPYEVYEKVDGWLGVLYRHHGRFKVSSRGSFHSTGATWATEYLQQFDLSGLPDEVTLVFEIIHPEHQIILDYGGRRELIVLSAFDRRTGREYPRTQVAAWAQAAGLPLVPLAAPMSLDDLLHTQKMREGLEGYVIRFADGRRVKVKTEWYVGMARIMSDLTPISVWNALVDGKVRTDYLVKIPEELRPLAERYASVLEGQYAQVMLAVERFASPLVTAAGGDRRALAERVNALKAAHGRFASTAFFVADGKRARLDEFAKNLIYPQGNKFATLDVP